MKIINFLFALISFASATLQLIAQNRLYNAIGNHNNNKYRSAANAVIPSYFLQVCNFNLKQATNDKQRSQVLRTLPCIKSGIKTTVNISDKQSVNEDRSKLYGFRKRLFLQLSPPLDFFS